MTESKSLTQYGMQAQSGAMASARAVFLPENYTQAVQLASDMAQSRVVPKHLQGDPAGCLAVVMQACRWGLDFVAVAAKSYNVNNVIAYEAQLINAVVLSSGVLAGRPKIEFSGEGESLRCTVTATIKGEAEPRTKSQMLCRVTVRNSPLWKSDPEQQLAYYTTRAWARMHTPDVLLGVFTRDEAQDFENEQTAIAAGYADSATPRRGDFQAKETAAEDADFVEVVDDDKKSQSDVKETEQQASVETATQNDPPVTTGEQDPDPENKVRIPETDEEWLSWSMAIRTKIAKRDNHAALDALEAKNAVAIGAAPDDIRMEVENHFMDRRIILGDQK